MTCEIRKFDPRACKNLPGRLTLFLPGPVRWRLSTTERKRLHASADTYGSLGGHGAWWFWLRRHRELVSYPRRIRKRLALSCRPADEAARVLTQPDHFLSPVLNLEDPAQA